MDDPRVLGALERIARAEERRNELVELDQALRRDLFDRDEAIKAARWDEISRRTRPSSEDLLRGVAESIGSPVTGASRIVVERARQIADEGYDAEHDRGLAEELARAAVAYALPEERRSPNGIGIPYDWPWGAYAWKPTPKDRVRELEKAGALIAAAIDALLEEQEAERKATT